MWVWPTQMIRASVAAARSKMTFASRAWSKPRVCEPGEACTTSTSWSSPARIRRSAGSLRSQSSWSSPSSSWAHSAASVTVSGTPSWYCGNAAP